jgi:hypothetical protein
MNIHKKTPCFSFCREDMNIQKLPNQNILPPTTFTTGAPFKITETRSERQINNIPSQGSDQNIMPSGLGLMQRRGSLMKRSMVYGSSSIPPHL